MHANSVDRAATGGTVQNGLVNAILSEEMPALGLAELLHGFLRGRRIVHANSVDEHRRQRAELSKTAS